MSAMSASSGLMPLSLISEHKAAQGGPPPVQPLSFASEKHSLVQAPKPTPNGMEPSPPLVPVMPPPQPEAHPSLPCGGVIESGSEEERSGGAVAEVQPLEPAPPTAPAVPEQQPAAQPAEPQPAPEPTASKATPTPSSPQPSAQGTPSPEPSVSLQSAPSPQSSQVQPPSATPQTVSSQRQTQDTSVAQTKPPQTQQEKQADSGPEHPTSESEKPVQPEAEPVQVKISNDTAVEKQKSESHNEQPPGDTAAAQQPKSEPAPPTHVAAPAPPSISSARVSKRTKNPSIGVEKKNTPAPVANTTPESETGDDKKAKRKRLPTQVYQSPIPELNIIAKMSKIDKTPTSDDKLIVFYRNEFLAVRNAEGSFYVCQAMQNVYKTSSRIRIRWLSQLANTDHYSPDFYDNTEFDCILTNLNLERIEKNKYRLPDIEEQRTQSILKRAIDVEKGIAPPEEATVTEEHPDGLDLSLYRNEEQLKTRKRGSRNKLNKKKIKKVIEAQAVKKSSRDLTRRKTVVEPPKKVNPIVNQQKRVARVPGKIEKPVVQRIVAAKKMGRRKTVSSPVANKAAPVAQAVKEVSKKKEVTRGAQMKRKSAEPQPSAVPEKKVKTGASKTRSGAAGGPSGPQPRARRATTRTK